MLDMRWKTAQRYFLLILFVTVLVNLLAILLFPISSLNAPQQPRYARQRRYLTVNCDDGRRLGNLMFNYASGLGIAARYNMTLVMPDDFQLYDYFQLSAIHTDNMKNILGGYTTYEEFGRRGCAYDIQTEHWDPSDPWSVRLNGFYQSWRYFAQIPAQLRHDFRFLPPIATEASLFHTSVVRQRIKELQGKESLAKKSVIKVGIHIRRGDMLDENRINYGYNTPGLVYYQKSIDYFRRTFPNNLILFIVCSDDLLWTKEHFQEETTVLCSADSKKHTPILDLAILSLCDHMIISVGSFGWWAAWLVNSNHTLYFGDWPRATSQLEYQVTKRDYFPPHWISISEKDEK